MMKQSEKAVYNAWKSLQASAESGHAGAKKVIKQLSGAKGVAAKLKALAETQ